MPSLILSYNNQELHTYAVERDHLLRIGRSDQNDIIIDETDVSSIHAEIEYEAGAYYITDIQSKNGTFVDGELVISRKLINGNIISIGDYSLLFQYKTGEPPPAEPDPVNQATMVIDTSIHRSKLAKSLAEISEEKNKPEAAATLIFLDDSHAPVVIDKPLFRIGKESDCDIKIKGLFIGKAGAEILKKDETFYLKPSVKKSKLRLNYKPVKSETALKDFDVIELGSTKLQFHFNLL